MQNQQQNINKSRLKMKRRLAADILKCGKQRIWMDPARLEEIAFANNRKAIRRLIDDQVIIRKPEKIRSRYKVRRKHAQIKRGRHSGKGRVRGAKNARHNHKENWMRRVRILRRLLHKYREDGKISKNLHRRLYLLVKGGHFKSKHQLMEEIFKMKEEEKRNQATLEELEFRRKKAIMNRKKRKEKEESKLQRRVQLAVKAEHMLKEAIKMATDKVQEEGGEDEEIKE